MIAFKSIPSQVEATIVLERRLIITQQTIYPKYIKYQRLSSEKTFPKSLKDFV